MVRGPPETQGAKVAQDRWKKILFTQLPDLQPATPAQQDPAITGIMCAMEGMHTLTIEDLADCQAKQENQKKAEMHPGNERQEG